MQPRIYLEPFIYQGDPQFWVQADMVKHTDYRFATNMNLS
jgi:hypothetical protein